MQAPKVMPVWPTWAMLGFFLLSLLTSFMTVSRTIVDLDDFEFSGSFAGIPWVYRSLKLKSEILSDYVIRAQIKYVPVVPCTKELVICVFEGAGHADQPFRDGK